jgi:hypothetical protein
MNPGTTTFHPASFRAPDQIRQHGTGDNGKPGEPPSIPPSTPRAFQQLPTHIPNTSDKTGNTPAYTAKLPPGKT